MVQFWNILTQNSIDMKKLNKLQINSERLLNNDELVTLRGGYGRVKCYSEWFVECGEGIVGDCSMADEACRILCGSFLYPICVNYE
jgi:hypothetical protein